MKKTLVTIKKSRWLRKGTSKGAVSADTDTYLRNKQGQMCCLGFICVQALGAKVKDILHKTHSPSDTYIPDWYTNHSTEAATINDDECTSDTQKIKELKELFSDCPITLKFVP